MKINKSDKIIDDKLKHIIKKKEVLNESISTIHKDISTLKE